MVTYAKISPKNGEPQRYSWGTQKKKKKKKRQLNLSIVPYLHTESCYSPVKNLVGKSYS